MANLSVFVIPLNDMNYPATNSAFLAYLEPYLTEVETARGGQASLLANMNYLLSQKLNMSGLTADYQLNGYRMRGAPVPVNSDELVNKAYADSLAFATALPSQAGNAGLEITTNGTVAVWGITAHGAMGILSYLGWGN